MTQALSRSPPFRPPATAGPHSRASSPCAHALKNKSTLAEKILKFIHPVVFIEKYVLRFFSLGKRNNEFSSELVIFRIFRKTNEINDLAMSLIIASV